MSGNDLLQRLDGRRVVLGALGTTNQYLAPLGALVGRSCSKYPRTAVSHQQPDRKLATRWRHGAHRLDCAHVDQMGHLVIVTCQHQHAVHRVHGTGTQCQLLAVATRPLDYSLQLVHGHFAVPRNASLLLLPQLELSAALKQLTVMLCQLRLLNKIVNGHFRHYVHNSILQGLD